MMGVFLVLHVAVVCVFVRVSSNARLNVWEH